MSVDWRGLAVTGADAPTLAAITRFQQDFQAFRDEAGAILVLADAVPECPLAQIYAAAMHVYSQAEAEIAANALPLLARARAAGGLHVREGLLLEATEAWARADFAGAAARFEEIAARWPQDVTAVKFAEFVFFEAPDFPRHLAFMETVAPANADLPCFVAMHAFACELNGERGRAIDFAERAIAADPDTPWAHHALAHAYLNDGRIKAGIAALDRHAASWDRHAQGIRGHNVWHLALLHLALMDADRAVALYREKIAGLTPASVFEHTDAVGLLWRLELAGFEVAPELWTPAADEAAARAFEAVMPFLNALYVHALVRAGRHEVAAAAIEVLSARKAGAGAPWTTGLGLVAGVAALAAGDAARGVAALEPVIATAGRVGGSDAQNDVFQLAFVRGLAAAGRPGDAAAAMARRLAGRRPTPFEAAVARP
jgi:tetratricopeptide (TPR) repeat protein